MTTNTYFKLGLLLPIAIPITALVSRHGVNALDPSHTVWESEYLWPDGVFVRAIMPGFFFYAVLFPVAWWLIGRSSPRAVRRIVVLLPFVFTAFVLLVVTAICVIWDEPVGTALDISWFSGLILGYALAHVLVVYLGYLLFRQASWIEDV